MAKAKTNEPKQIKMTDEIRAKMYGFLFVSGSVILSDKITIEGVPEQFLPTLRLKTLSISELESLDSAKGASNGESIYQEIVRTHTVGWSNMIDLSTEELVPYVGDDDGCDEDLFKGLRQDLKVYILQRLITISKR